MVSVGKSIRRPVSPKRQLKKNICFLVEGTTEENVIDHCIIKLISLAYLSIKHNMVAVDT